jgi:nitrogen regulatory protein PII
MKKLEVFLREEAVDGVKNALRDIGIVGMSIHPVRGQGRKGGVELSYRGTRNVNAKGTRFDKTKGTHPN